MDQTNYYDRNHSKSMCIACTINHIPIQNIGYILCDRLSLPTSITSNMLIKFHSICHIEIIHSSINEIINKLNPNKIIEGSQVARIIGICSDVPSAIKSLCIK